MTEKGGSQLEEGGIAMPYFCPPPLQEKPTFEYPRRPLKITEGLVPCRPMF